VDRGFEFKPYATILWRNDLLDDENYFKPFLEWKNKVGFVVTIDSTMDYMFAVEDKIRGLGCTHSIDSDYQVYANKEPEIY